MELDVAHMRCLREQSHLSQDTALRDGSEDQHANQVAEQHGAGSHGQGS